MHCQSCSEEYSEEEAGTCKECYEEASETEGELHREIAHLRSLLAFLRLDPPEPAGAGGGDGVVRLRSGERDEGTGSGSGGDCDVAAHRAVLVSRSPVFKAMLATEMEESRSGVIKIPDASPKVLQSFITYLYTAETSLDEETAPDLLILAEKYQVSHLKSSCERFLTSKLAFQNCIRFYEFASRYGAKQLCEAALGLIVENLGGLKEREEYRELVERDPRLVVEIYEAYLAKQVNLVGVKV